VTELSDYDLGELLKETFAAHENLADPERAVAIAAVPDRPPRMWGRAVLGAAAAVAVLAAGTTYVESRDSGVSGPPQGGPRSTRPSTGTGQPPLPPLQTEAANHAAAVAAADAAAAGLPTYPGAQETDATGVPELDDTTLSSVQPSRVVVRSRFWTVSGVTSKAVAQWYAAHPASGFSSGDGVGGQGDGTTWIDEVYWQPNPAPSSQQGTWAEIETTTIPGGVGIRVTVSSVWLPPRPLPSYVQDVSSIDVRTEHSRLGPHAQHTSRTFTITSPAKIRRASVAFNALPGMTPMVVSCPMSREEWTDRIVFHTASGDVVAVDQTSSCGSGMTVRRDGRVVLPQLGDPQALLATLGVHH
jgi:hypothetical protein